MSVRALAELLAAIGGAHTSRAMTRAIARALWFPTTHVELVDHGVAMRLGDDWRVVERADVPLAEVVPGLRIAGRAELTDELRVALAEAIAMARRHLDVVRRVAELSRRAHADAREMRRTEPRELVARSPAMRDVLARATQVARHDTTVLIAGESGTGKEVLAREIHRRSTRAHRPLVAVDCGAIPLALVEAELFGHERGAFTGADRARPGVFERAHRGTLFLDEIGELPLAAQAKLLRVLQEREVCRLGGTPHAIDVRVIAATNRSLEAMVHAGTFREDLYYRLAVFAIELPPLRDRREDIAPLATALLAELAAKLRVPACELPLDRLTAYDWPGNVRELANVLETALIVGELPTLRRREVDTSFAASSRDAIEAALRATRGKIYGPDGAAARLGLKPATLQSKMHKLGIERARFALPRERALLPSNHVD